MFSNLVEKAGNKFEEVWFSRPAMQVTQSISSLLLCSLVLQAGGRVATCFLLTIAGNNFTTGSSPRYLTNSRALNAVIAIAQALMAGYGVILAKKAWRAASLRSALRPGAFGATLIFGHLSIQHVRLNKVEASRQQPTQ